MILSHDTNPGRIEFSERVPPRQRTAGLRPRRRITQNLQFLLQPRPGQPQGTLQQSMRAMLRNPAIGTAVAGSTRVMPDMGKLIATQYLP